MGASSRALLDALTSTNVEPAGAHMEELAGLFREKGWKAAPMESLILAWRACLTAIQLELKPEVRDQTSRGGWCSEPLLGLCF